MNQERKKYSGFEVNGWRTLNKEKPTSNDIGVWKRYTSDLLKELKLNTEDYPYSRLREPIFVDRFKSAIDPILVIGLINQEVGRNIAELMTYHRSWEERRDAACIKGYTIQEFEEYIAGSQRGRVFRILTRKR